MDWKYEQEWRVIGDKGIGIYAPEHIDRIIFGLKMPQEERNTIQHLLKDRNVKFFEAIKSKQQFAIEILPLNESKGLPITKQYKHLMSS